MVGLDADSWLVLVAERRRRDRGRRRRRRHARPGRLHDRCGGRAERGLLPGGSGAGRDGGCHGGSDALDPGPELVQLDERGRGHRCRGRRRRRPSRSGGADGRRACRAGTQGYYRSGPLGADGMVTDWRDWVAVPDWRFWENQGAGDRGRRPGRRRDAGARGARRRQPARARTAATTAWAGAWTARPPADGWGPWQPVPDWRLLGEPGRGALAVAKLGPRACRTWSCWRSTTRPGPTTGGIGCWTSMTDLEMAAEMGVWRLLEDDSVVKPVHAALLHTGGVLFFAGSGNDPGPARRPQYATAVWHYPAPRFSRPDTPVDLFCCGHAFLPDGRLLGGGWNRAVRPVPRSEAGCRVRPVGGPPDPWKPHRHGRCLDGGAGHGGRAVVSDAARRWPTGGCWRCQAWTRRASSTSSRRPMPTAWAGRPLPRSPRTGRMYCAPVPAADGRVFYSGGQYGANNGVRPDGLGPGDERQHRRAGCAARRQQARNQSASVLLPPAQDQRVMIMGGGPFDMHDQTGATASMAVADLAAAQPAVRAGRRPERCADASVRDPAARPHRARQWRRDDGGERGAGGAGGRDLPPGLRGSERAYGRWRPRSRVRAALPLGGPADAGRQGDHRWFEPGSARPRSCGSRCSGRRTCSPARDQK